MQLRKLYSVEYKVGFETSANGLQEVSRWVHLS